MNKTDRSLLIIMDWKPPANWTFLSSLTHLFGSVEIHATDVPKSFNNRLEKVFKVWKGYLLSTLHVSFRASRYDVIYAWHAVMGLILAGILRLAHIQKPRVVIAQFIEPDRGDGWMQRLRQAFVRYGLKRVDLVLTFSSIEVTRYRQQFKAGHTQFDFIPLGYDFSSQPVSDEGYIFSGGRSNRDYQTLVEAVKDNPVATHIVAQRHNLQGILLPDHIQAYYGVFGVEFDRFIANAHMVVVPLDRADESSGQLVVLQAMAYGKPVIVTENAGILDYIEPGTDALVVPPHDSQALRRAILRISGDHDLWQQLSHAGQQRAQDYTLHRFAHRVAGRLALFLDA